MPKFKGVSDYFAKIEAIQTLGSVILDNKLGNKILYPDTVPETANDLNFELALYRKIIELSKDDFYNQSSQRIDIPEQLITRFGDLQKTIWIFIESIKPFGIIALWKSLPDFTSTCLGTLISPEIESENCFITLSINKKQYQIKGGSTILIPATENKINLIFSATGAKLLGKQLLSMQVSGGEIGIIVDARLKK